MYGGTSSSGSASFVAKNPKYGTLISFYLSEGHQSLTAQRKKEENNGKIDTWIIEELKKSNYNVNSLIEVSSDELVQKTNLDINTIENAKKVL